jgi:hypothetical protein
MAEKQENKKAFSTCMEGIPFAEMVKKMKDKKGVGSLCAEMMKKVMEKKGDGGNFSCAKAMQSMMKGCSGIKKETKETKKEENHVGEK